jgi:glycosyltransferase involved in cell wall biosynthesis
MIAYYFPPVGGIAAAGSQRTLKFAKYLPRYGWEPVILTVKETSYENYLTLDPTLLSRVPSDTKIIRTSVIRWLTRILELKNRRRRVVSGQHPSGPVEATQRLQEKSRLQSFKDSLTGLCEIPDDEIGWLLPAIVAGHRAIKRHAIDVIYATGKPWTAHLIGLALKLLTGKPLVVDFRDPWMTNPFRGQMSRLRDRIEGYMEKKVVEIADVVVTNTSDLRAEFLTRFPRESGEKFVAVLNGFDPEDCQPARVPRVDPEKFTVTHTGFLYGKRDPRLFIEAIAFLIETQKVDRKRFRVRLVGSVELSYDLPELIRSRGIEDVVQMVDQVPYDQSLQYLINSDALLLLQPGTTTQIPSKLFEYIALGKPVIAISPPSGATSRIVLDNLLGTAADADNIVDTSSAVEEVYRKWLSGNQSCWNNGGRERFDVQNVTAVLAERFNTIALRQDAQSV